MAQFDIKIYGDKDLTVYQPMRSSFPLDFWKKGENACAYKAIKFCG